MRRQTVAIAVLALLASTGHAAQAKQACPTLKDISGDTGAFGYHVQDDATDITALKVSTTKQVLTAAINVVGQPANNDPGVSRRYEVYFDTLEGTYVLRGTLGNGQSRFQLVQHTAVGTPQGSSVESWQRGKTLQGSVNGNTVTITAPLDRDLPLMNMDVDVSARTWIADGISVGEGAFEGASIGVDKAGTRTIRVGDPGCA